MQSKSLLSLGLSLVFTICSVSYLQAQNDKGNPFATNIIGTLANPRMAGELELLDEQKENVDQLMKEFGQFQRDVGAEMKSQWEVAGDEERKELGMVYWRRIEEERLKVVNEMKANLLPHQIDRVEQLSAQRMMTEGKGRESAGLLSDQMVNYLSIGANQKQRIKAKSEKLKKEVGEKIQKILEEAKQELLAELNADQKRKYEELVGDPVSKEGYVDQARGKKQKSRPN